MHIVYSSLRLPEDANYVGCEVRSVSLGGYGRTTSIYNKRKYIGVRRQNCLRRQPGWRAHIYIGGGGVGGYKAHVLVIDSLNNSDCPGGSVACFMMGEGKKNRKDEALGPTVCHSVSKPPFVQRKHNRHKSTCTYGMCETKHEHVLHAQNLIQ